MLNFVLSTIAFSLAIYGFDHYFKAKSVTKTDKHKFLVFVLATLISIGVGYLVDIVDGDFYLPKKDIALVDVMKSGDPLLIAKTILGIN